MELPINKIINGDALTILKTLPDESVNCVVTSPPYWSLRDYGSQTETIWGGDKDCQHDFNVVNRRLHGGTMKEDFQCTKGARAMTDWVTKDGFCNKCGAWRGQLGLEPHFNEYISHLCDIFDEVKRVLKKDGTCWVNLGDTYRGGHIGGSIHTGLSKRYDSNVIPQQVKGRPAGSLKDYKEKCLCCIPDRFKIEMINRGWICRNEIIWFKNNVMPTSTKDRLTIDYEKIFFFVKSKKYFFNQMLEPVKSETINRNKYGWDGKKKAGAYAVKIDKGSFATNHNGEAMRNKRCVWNINTRPFKEAHFSTYPEALIEPMIKAGCKGRGIVLDPFMGSGTTALVALKQGKKFIGIELNESYIKIAEARINKYLEQQKL